jgi:putative NADH-flavin reductase
MRLSLFGATGGIGRFVLEQALAAGHDVTVLTREAGKVADPAAGDRLRVVVGDIEQYESVVDVVAGSEAVISALGPTRNAADQVELFGRWAGHLVRATEAHGPARVVILSGAAVNVPGEQKAIGDRIASAVVRAFVRHVVAAKQAEFEIISRSSLEWIAARPPRVVPGPRTGRYDVGTDLRLGPRSRISQPDLAEFLLRQVSDDTWLRQAPFVSS